MNRSETSIRKMAMCGITVLGLLVTFSGASFAQFRTGFISPAEQEKSHLQLIDSYESSKAQVMKGDNFPRRLRLADAYVRMGQFYSSTKQFDKAKPYFEKCLAIVRQDKTESGVDYHRYLVHAISEVYFQNHDYEQAMKYVDEAADICRTVPKEKEVLHTVLRTKSDIFRAMKKYKEAEQHLLEAIDSWKPFAYSDQIALAELYVEMKENDKAKAVLDEAKSSQYKDNSWLSAYAKYLRATGKIEAAEQLDQHVKTLKERGE